MPKILPIKLKLVKKIKKHGLWKKFQKQIKFLEKEPAYSSLHVELLEPKQYGIYSFRIDRKYRALFFYRPDKEEVEIINITVHYH